MTKFYEILSGRMFRDTKRETCCCTVCMEGDDTFSALFDLIKEVCSEDMGKVLTDAALNLQHILKWHYKALVQQESTQLRRCGTFALSQPDRPEYKHACNHPEAHEDSDEALQLFDVLMKCIKVEVDSRQFAATDDREEAERVLTSVEKGLLR